MGAFCSKLSNKSNSLETPLLIDSTSNSINPLVPLPFIRQALFENTHFKPLVNEIPEKELNEFLKTATIVELKQGGILFEQGDSSNEMYVVGSGTLIVSKDGKELIRVLSGKCVGEIAFINSSLRMASISANEKCVLYKLLKSEYDKFMAKRRDPLTHLLILTKKPTVQTEIEKFGINPDKIYAGCYAKKKMSNEIIFQRRFIWIELESKRLFWAKSEESKSNPSKRKFILLSAATVGFESPIEKTRCILLTQDTVSIVLKIPGPKTDSYCKDLDVNTWFQVIMTFRHVGAEEDSNDKKGKRQ